MVEEWLDTYNYYCKLCPSQAEEMTQIGALCYSNVFMYREDLKAAIINHPLWLPQDSSNPPIFDLYLSDFIAQNNKARMIFVSAEQSKARETADLFKKLNDGSPKAYPNGYMMLFIPLLEGHQPSNEFCAKVLFNHEKYIGEEEAFSIGGFQDLKTQVKLKNGSTVSLCTLIKSIPLSSGMSRPQLFQQVEPKISGIVTMVTFQKQDHDLVYQCQNTLESEIRQIIAEGQEYNVFVDDADGIWFGGVNKTKTGRILAAKQVDKSSLEYTKHISRFMNSPPKKRSSGVPLPPPKTVIVEKPTFYTPSPSPKFKHPLGTPFGTLRLKIGLQTSTYN
jgi:hypothetical protein